MKTVTYLPEALKDLKRHRNVSDLIRKAIADYAATGSRVNNVTRLVGSTASRLRVGDYRVIFEDGPAEIVVTKVGPRGGIYD